MIEFNATLIVAMLSFVVFMFIMNAIFYKPILNIIRKRETYIDQNYTDAKDFNQKAQDLAEDHDQKLNEAKEIERQKNVQVLEELQNRSFDKIQKAKENSRDEIQQKKDILTQEKNGVQERINNEIVPDVASLITEKILNKG